MQVRGPAPKGMLGADADLRSIVSSWWGQTLDDNEILGMMRDWNAGVPVFAKVRASRGAHDNS